MLDFQIKEMYRHHLGFIVAEVLSHRDQEVYIVHDRYGSWMVGDPDAKSGHMREAATVSHDLAPALAARKSVKNAHFPEKGAAPNPFILKAQAREAAKTNPLVARLVAQGKA